MCLSVPGKIVAIKGDEATVDYVVERRKGKLLEDGYSVGEYVNIQGGFVVAKVEAKEAKAALKLYAAATKDA